LHGPIELRIAMDLDSQVVLHRQRVIILFFGLEDPLDQPLLAFLALFQSQTQIHRFCFGSAEAGGARIRFRACLSRAQKNLPAPASLVGSREADVIGFGAGPRQSSDATTVGTSRRQSLQRRFASPQRKLPAALVKRSVWIPAAVLLLSFAELVVVGKRATRVLAENLPTPLNSTGKRIVDLVHPTATFGRLYDFSFTARPDAASYPSGSRLRIQLSSNGKTRLIVARPGHPPGSRRDALRDLARGSARLEIVADRGWIDLGPPPAPSRESRVQLVGLLPGPFGFAELDSPANPVFSRLQIWRPDVAEFTVLSTAPRYRIIAPAPVEAGETLARFFFFISISRVLQITGIAALVLLFVGWRALAIGEAARAVSCLIPSVVLLHAICLPPLQGADETSHIATVEKIVFGEIPPKLETYPRSISLVAQALEQNRVQHHPDEPLPLGSPADRSRLRSLLQSSLAKEAVRDGPLPPATGIQSIDARAPLFFRPFRVPAPLLRKLSVLDRMSSYRLLATVSGLFLFCCGAWLLRRARLSEQATLLYGLVFLVPYMVGASASCSNYAPAIGLGSLLAAAALTTVLAPSGREKAFGAVLLVSGSWFGVPIWPDFIFAALVSTLVVLAWWIDHAAQTSGGRIGGVLRWAAGSALVLLFLAGLLGFSRLKLGNIGTRMPLDLPRLGSHEMTLIILTVAAPFLLAGLAALAVARLGRRGFPRIERDLHRVSIGVAVVLVVGFLLTPYTVVPFERSRPDLGGLVPTHNLSFWSNNFSWDQDRLFWKFYWGAFGWHDAFYPDWLYALARWLAVALLILLPVLSVRCLSSEPRIAALLLLISGTAISFSFATEILRYFLPANTIGRFLLPYLPLIVLPVVIMTCAPGRKRILRRTLAVGVALHVWTAIVVLGSRYVLGS